jgi:hypothetical protein
MANAGFRLAEAVLDEPLADGSAYRGRLLHYRRGCRTRSSSFG